MTNEDPIRLTGEQLDQEPPAAGRAGSGDQTEQASSVTAAKECECPSRKALEGMPCRCMKVVDANNCPQRGGLLHPVRYSSGSMLNRYQFDAARAGDYYCESCKGTEAATGYKYFWESDFSIKIEKCNRCAALSVPCPCGQSRQEYDRLGLSYCVLEGQYKLAGQIICAERAECDSLRAELATAQAEITRLRAELTPIFSTGWAVLGKSGDPSGAAWEALVAYAYADGKDGAREIQQITEHYNWLRDKLSTTQTECEQLREFKVASIRGAETMGKANIDAARNQVKK